MQNQTTIESHEGVTARKFYERSGIEFRNPYDLGLSRNWQVRIEWSGFWGMPSVLSATTLAYTGHLASVAATQRMIVCSRHRRCWDTTKSFGSCRPLVLAGMA